MRPVLTDPELDGALRTDGYVVVQLLEQEELAEIQAAQLELRGSDDSGLVIDFARTDREAMHRIHDLLAPMWDRHLPGLFDAHRPVVSTFVVKHPGCDSEMLLHNEPTFVDPDLGPCFNVWVPLVDVDTALDNGVLELVPGSQRLPFGLSGFDTPVLFRPFEQYIRSFSVPLEVKAGQAVIYDTRMLHASRANRSDDVRPAIAAAVAPIGAQLIHVLAAGRHLREVFEVDEDFFLDHHPMEVHRALRADYQLVDRRWHERGLTGSEVAAALGGTGAPAPEVVVPADVADMAPADDLRVLPVVDVEVVAVPPSAMDAIGDPGGLDEANSAMAWGLDPIHGTSRLAAVGEEDGRPAVGPMDAVLGSKVLVVLDRGARARLVGDLSGSALVVLDAAMVSAGILHDHRVAQLEPGVRVELRAVGPAILWNDGACPLVVAVIEAGAARRRRSPVERVRRLLTRGRRRH